MAAEDSLLFVGVGVFARACTNASNLLFRLNVTATEC